MKSTKAKDDERPICPYCEKELDEIKTKEFDKGKTAPHIPQLYIHVSSLQKGAGNRKKRMTLFANQRDGGNGGTAFISHTGRVEPAVPYYGR
jgi:hypothetical protein